jgi:hypothetical protein
MLVNAGLKFDTSSSSACFNRKYECRNMRWDYFASEYSVPFNFLEVWVHFHISCTIVAEPKSLLRRLFKQLNKWMLPSCTDRGLWQSCTWGKLVSCPI